MEKIVEQNSIVCKNNFDHCAKYLCKLDNQYYCAECHADFDKVEEHKDCLDCEHEGYILLNKVKKQMKAADDSPALLLSFLELIEKLKSQIVAQLSINDDAFKSEIQYYIEESVRLANNHMFIKFYTSTKNLYEKWENHKNAIGLMNGNNVKILEKIQEDLSEFNNQCTKIIEKAGILPNLLNKNAKMILPIEKYKKVEKMPETHPKVAAIESRLGPFKYEPLLPKHPDLNTKSSIIRGPDWTYTGELNIYGERHGNGVLIYDNGNKYEGEWHNDALNGKGRCIWTNESYYEGYFKNDLYHGKGKVVYLTKEIYEGDFSNGYCHGMGKKIEENENQYYGQWANDKYHGKGKIVYANGDVYEGEISNTKANGKGKFTMTDGLEYNGDLANGIFHGNGKLVETNGEVYEGHFSNHLPHGFLAFTASDKKATFSGEFKNGLRHGMGTETINNTTIKGIWKCGEKEKIMHTKS